MTPNWALESQEFAARRKLEGTQAFLQGVDRLQRGVDTAYGAFSDQQRLALSAQAQAFDQQQAMQRQQMEDEENKARIALMEQRWAEGERNLMASQALMQAGVNEEAARTQVAQLRAQRKMAEQQAKSIDEGTENRSELVRTLLSASAERAEQIGLKVVPDANGRLTVVEKTDEDRKRDASMRGRRLREQIGVGAARGGLARPESVLQFIENGQPVSSAAQEPPPSSRGEGLFAAKLPPVPSEDTAAWSQEELFAGLKTYLPSKFHERIGEIAQELAPVLSPQAMAYAKMRMGERWGRMTYLKQIVERLKKGAQ